jgi:hypothetical protein
LLLEVITVLAMEDTVDTEVSEEFEILVDTEVSVDTKVVDIKFQLQ